MERIFNVFSHIYFSLSIINLYERRNQNLFEIVQIFTGALLKWIR